MVIEWDIAKVVIRVARIKSKMGRLNLGKVLMGILTMVQDVQW